MEKTLKRRFDEASFWNRQLERALLTTDQQTGYWLRRSLRSIREELKDARDQAHTACPNLGRFFEVLEVHRDLKKAADEIPEGEQPYNDLMGSEIAVRVYPLPEDVLTRDWPHKAPHEDDKRAGDALSVDEWIDLLAGLELV